MSLILDRLRADFRLSIITLLGCSALLGVTPFAVYRFVQGQIVAGAVDCMILAGILLTMVYAWRYDDTWHSGLFMSVFACGGAAVVASLQGDGTGILWVYPAIMASFFMTTQVAATCISVITVLVLALLLNDVAFNSGEQLATFVTTCIIVSACAFIFSRRNDDQRRKLRDEAAYDSLTGIKNRRAMDAELDNVVMQAQFNDTSHVLVMIDLDHFKRINDSHGHNVGDQVLIQCARALQSGIRNTDQLFRYGGEEFVIVYHGIEHHRIDAVLSHLRRRVMAQVRSPSGAVTASFGAAILNANESWVSWRDRADKAMYWAKKAGRNCYVIDEYGL